MNREIKFRIWADNQFYYKCLVGNTNDIEDSKWTCPMVWLEDTKEWVNCDNGIVSQYTGLHDKNGVEIYEGDIIADESRMYKKIVQWSDILCGFIPYCDEKLEIFEHTCEVIGNYWENKDLLEVEDENN